MSHKSKGEHPLDVVVPPPSTWQLLGGWHGLGASVIVVLVLMLGAVSVVEMDPLLAAVVSACVSFAIVRLLLAHFRRRAIRDYRRRLQQYRVSRGTDW